MASSAAASATQKAMKTLTEIFKAMAKEQNFQRISAECKLTGGGVGQCICELTVEEKHTNPFKTLHGGLTASLIDITSTAALVTQEHGQAGLSVDLNVTYMRPARIGETVVFDARVLKAGKSLAFVQVDIKGKENDDLLAIGRQTVKLL